MLGHLSNDVLGLVANFVCPPTATTAEVLEHSPKWLALGHPLSHAVLNDSRIAALRRKFIGKVYHGCVDFLVSAGRHAAERERNTLYANLYQPLGRTANTRDLRTLIKAALRPLDTRSELRHCDK
jgi:hypothetical protein